VAALAILVSTGALPLTVVAAAAPGLATSVLVAARPPAPTRLRTLGWTLVGVSIATAAIVVIGTSTAA
jgi:hypothetical protein